MKHPLSKLDKRDRSDIFRSRLAQAMADAGHTRAGLARQIGVDRSTLSQILTPDSTRLPGGQMIATTAQVLGVSSDWLLGLTDLPHQASDVLANALDMSPAERALVDEQVFGWHREATGYKIRHVPATLPDMLKTHAFLRWEYESHLGRTPDEAISAVTERMDWLQDSSSDYEIALPQHEMDSFAAGTGYYAGLPLPVRRAQLDWMIETYDYLYPSLRVFVFDARRVFSAPISIFGPLLAVLYVGRTYISFRERDRVRTLTQHFDWLIRECETGAHEMPRYLKDLRKTM